jgi:hypothetical protein
MNEAEKLLYLVLEFYNATNYLYLMHKYTYFDSQFRYFINNVVIDG